MCRWELNQLFNGKNILVTGGTGSFGKIHFGRPGVPGWGYIGQVLFNSSARGKRTGTPAVMTK